MDGTMVLSRVQFLTTDGGIIKRSQVSKAFIPLRKASRTTRKGIDDWTLSSSAYIPYPKVEHPKMRGGNATALSLGSLGIYTKIFNSLRCVETLMRLTLGKSPWSPAGLSCSASATAEMSNERMFGSG